MLLLHLTTHWVINQGATITGDIALSGNIDAGDSNTIRLGADDDLLIYHLAAGAGGNYIAGANNMGIVISAEKVELLNQGHSAYYFKGEAAGSVVYHNNDPRVTTTATGITVTGEIDDVGNVNTTGNIVSTGGNSLNHQLGNSSAAKLGVGRAATTYNLEVEGSIFATGSSLIIGDTGTSKAIIQKRTVGLGLHFTDESGVDQAELDGNGNFGIGKAPSYRLDVSGNSWIDGDITINTTNPVTKTGGKIWAREIQLVDPQTGATTILDTTSAGGVSRAKVYFHSFN